MRTKLESQLRDRQQKLLLEIDRYILLYDGTPSLEYLANYMGEVDGTIRMRMNLLKANGLIDWSAERPFEVTQVRNCTLRFKGQVMMILPLLFGPTNEVTSHELVWQLID